ncbi:hypothetical protein E2542_SST26698 [Spatholobus suberectus]|nr:hypothetical protein E2542_SST26698 [Spatholobus suberectus]
MSAPLRASAMIQGGVSVLPDPLSLIPATALLRRLTRQHNSSTTFASSLRFGTRRNEDWWCLRHAARGEEEASRN